MERIQRRLVLALTTNLGESRPYAAAKQVGRGEAQRRAIRHGRVGRGAFLPAGAWRLLLVPPQLKY